MGVTGLWTIIQSCAYPIKPESLEGKILAIDISIWLHQALHGYASPNLTNYKPHIHLILTRIFKLLHYKIKPIFIFDGGIPQLKKRTMLTRQEKRNNTLQNIEGINSQIIKNKILEDILHKYLGAEISSKPIFKSIEDKDLFELPVDTYPNAIKEIDQGWEKRKLSIANALKHLAQMNEDIDIDSETFNKLPKDIQHEILQELQMANKHPPVNNLISKSDKINDFSDYQIKRLLNLSKISSKIDQVNRDMNLDYVQKLASVTDDFSHQDLTNAQIQRMASDETIHYVLVKRKSNYNALKQTEPSQAISNLATIIPDPVLKNNIIAGDSNVYFKDPSGPNSYQGSFDLASLVPEFLNDMKLPIVDRGVGAEEIAGSDLHTTRGANKSSVLSEKEGINTTEYNSINYSINRDNFNNIEDGFKIFKNETAVTPVTPKAISKSSSKLHKNRNKIVKRPFNSRMGQIYSFLNLKQRKKAYQRSISNKLKYQPMGNSRVVKFKPIRKLRPFNLRKSSHRSNRPIVWTDSTVQAEDIILPELTIDEKAEPMLEQSEFTSNKGGPSNQTPVDVTNNETDTACDELPNLFDTDPRLKTIKDKLIKEPKEVYDDVVALNLEKGKLERYSKTMSQAVYEETQELLRIMGIPWMIAPMEAEAQCAYLDMIGLTHGSVTDDSDVWLFGGGRVYRNFYSTAKDMEFYNMESIEKNLGLDREKLIMIAMMVGCDYSFGIRGIGPVMALEILSEFGISTFEDLQKFKLWWNDIHYTSVKDPDTLSNLQKRLRDMFIHDSFPEPAVFQAFLQPKVEESRESFIWGSPDFELLHNFVRAKLLWTKEKLESYLNPLRKRLAEKRIQHTMEEYCAPKGPDIWQEVMPNKRIQNALTKMRSKMKAGNSLKNDPLARSASKKDRVLETVPKSSQVSQKNSSKPKRNVSTKGPKRKKTKFSSQALQDDFALNLSEESD